MWREGGMQMQNSQACVLKELELKLTLVTVGAGWWRFMNHWTSFMLPLCTAAWRRERPSCKKGREGDQWEKGQKPTSCTSAFYLRNSCKFHSQRTTSLISQLHSCSLNRNRTTSSRPAHAAVNSGVQWCYQMGRTQCQMV